MIAINVTSTPRVHVRFDGHSYDFTATEFNLSSQPTDAEVRLALAMLFEVPIGRLAPYVIERHGNGNLTVRPEAMFG